LFCGISCSSTWAWPVIRASQAERPEQGALKTQLGVTLFREPVHFDDKDTPARLFVTLAAQDANSHLDALVAVSELLDQPEKVEQILAAKDAETLYNYFQ